MVGSRMKSGRESSRLCRFNVSKSKSHKEVMKLVCREVVRRQLAAEVNSSTSQLAALSIASGVVFCCGLRLKNLTGALDAL